MRATRLCLKNIVDRESLETRDFRHMLLKGNHRRLTVPQPKPLHRNWDAQQFQSHHDRCIDERNMHEH